MLVCGPPSAGKSTWVQQRAGLTDVVVDLDAIATGLAGTSGHDHPEMTRQAARQLRDRLERRIAKAGHVTAWVIRLAPTAGERLQLTARLRATEVVVLDPGRDEALARAAADGRPDWTAAAIDRWYAQQSLTDHR